MHNFPEITLNQQRLQIIQPLLESFLMVGNLAMEIKVSILEHVAYKFLDSACHG
jgi:hypothetical protein